MVVDVVEFTTAVCPLGTVTDKEETEIINENKLDHARSLTQ